MGLGEELRLAWFVGLNALVLASAWRFATRAGRGSLSQSLLDTLLLNYLIQYAIVCGLGVCGVLSPVAIACAAMLLCGGLWIGTIRPYPVPPLLSGLSREGRIALALLTFAGGYLLAYAFDHRNLPVLETDALAYHLPTAIGWLQSGHLSLFESWYWNPANTYSPLAAEAFMAWMLAPMRSDVLVRFVQVPALLMVGLAMYRIGRQLGSRPIVAACIAVTAMLSRSIFAQATLVKDDLFVAAFFLTAVAAMGEMGGTSPDGSDVTARRLANRVPPWRVGIAVGLLVAIKYPALLTLPLLLLALPISTSFRHKKWVWKSAVIAASVPVALAGPWFLRNWFVFGNPLFPMIIRVGGHTLFHGMFNVTRDPSTRTPAAIWTMVTTGYFGMPGAFLVLLVLFWLMGVIAVARRSKRFASEDFSPGLSRLALWGPIVGPMFFSVASPHPEIRYFFPFLLPLFASTNLGLRVFDGAPKMQIAIAAVIAVLATMTSFESQFLSYVGYFSLAALSIAATAWTTATLWLRYRRVVIALVAIFIALLSLLAYVDWRAYMSSLADAQAIAWPDQYGPLGAAWIAVRDQLPPDARIAYANTYLIYPLFGQHEQRVVFYAPVRPGEHTFADLPCLGDRVPQDRIVPTVTAAMNEGADERTWLDSLHKQGATDLFIAKTHLGDHPPELGFAHDRPDDFRIEFENEAAAIYHVMHRTP